MEIKEIIGQNIARYRKEKDFTQEDLAKELGISFQAISKWERGNAFVNTFRADINDYRINSKYDILFSSGVLHYIKPELRKEIFENYKENTNTNGIHVFNVFVDKPFIEAPPENEPNAYSWISGELLTYYHNWEILKFEEVIFDCQSSGIPHKHAMNIIIARKR